MKKLLGIFLLLCAVFSSRAAFPVFLGGTLDYITNSAPGTIMYVYSNEVRIISFRSPGGTTVYTNGPVAIYAKPGNSVSPFSVFDTNGNRQFVISSNMPGVVRLGTNVNGYLTVSNNAAVTNSSLQSGGNAPTYFMGPGGNIGIRTATPAVPLEVNGIIQSSAGSSSAPGLQLGSSLFGFSGADNGLYLFGNGTPFLWGRAGVAATLATNVLFGFAPGITALAAVPSPNWYYAGLGTNGFGAGAASPSGTLLGSNVLLLGALGVGTTLPGERLDVLANGQFGSNVVFTNISFLAATNGSANTNITVDYNQAITDLYLTNNASFTNHSGLAAGKSKSVTLFITPTAINRTIVWPTLGAPSFGTYWFTNSFSPMWTTLTSGVTYALSLTTRGTNVHASITEWK